MREILFRGKSIVANTPNTPGYWMEGNLFHQTRTSYGENVNCYHILDGNKIIEGPDYETEVWPETVGQFTGLLDKKGKKIFEGDIVKTKYGSLCIVIWFSSHEHNNLEVIGNIHDNPELMR